MGQYYFEMEGLETKPRDAGCKDMFLSIHKGSIYNITLLCIYLSQYYDTK